MVKNYKPCKKTAQKIKPDELDAYELLKKYMDSCLKDIALPDGFQYCFVTSSVETLHFAKVYFKDTNIKTILHDGCPRDTYYLIRAEDLERKVGEGD